MQLTIDVFFYGSLAEHVGMNQIEVALTKSMTVADVKQLLHDELDNWHNFQKPIYHVKNRHLVDEQTLVNSGDVLAFFADQPLL